jgi:predicted nicotinamide N-methyase
VRRNLDPARFIRENLNLAPAPGVPEIQLLTAHPGSGLWRLAAEDDEAEPPYWAYAWGGGIVLARHVLDNPQIVRGARVLDLGTGGGVVAIAAALAGAAQVIAADIEPMAIAALCLNAKANDVAIEAVCADITGAAPPAVDLILIGDLFFETSLAKRVGAFADRAKAAGIEVLIGDPGRASLPREKLSSIGRYRTGDFAAASAPAEVFSWRAAAAVVLN